MIWDLELRFSKLLHQAGLQIPTIVLSTEIQAGLIL
jgi:hypothetical protein